MEVGRERIAFCQYTDTRRVSHAEFPSPRSSSCAKDLRCSPELVLISDSAQLCGELM